jgi:non-specific serine/threonine protein kinase/serine/threonine-protein kinase
VRFEIVRPHAKGGLGKVSVALDKDLNREVALKEIQQRFVNDPSARLRFMREAEITGGLEHPGIVPVYALGTHPDGLPFYAMKFIRGESLHDAVQVFHAKTKLDFESLEFRKLLQRFVDVCNAVAYAHARGVLHRDLKPANVMLGGYGETLVVDWGLAKATGKWDATSETLPSSEPTLKPASGSSGETLPGQAIGTPAYMPPEQAAGRLEQLGPASDVYSLGATLYFVLTGKAAFEGPLKDVLPRVQRGEFPTPRERTPAVPKPLDAIVRRAMALKPADRYASAGQLSREIEAFLADEPVAAMPETVRDRLNRFQRKNRSAVQTALAASLLLALGASVAAVVINGQSRANRVLANEKSRLADEKTMLAEEKTKLAASESEARARAEKLANEKTALAEAESKAKAEAVQRSQQLQRGNELLTAVFQDLDPNSEEKDGRPVRVILGDRLALAADMLLGDAIGDTVVVAQMQSVLSVCLNGLGRYAEAAGIANKSFETLRQLIGPDDPVTLRSMQRLAGSLKDTGRLAEALILSEECLRRSRAKLGDDHPDTLRSMGTMTATLTSLGRTAEALPLYDETLRRSKATLGTDHPFTIACMNNMAAALSSLGRLNESLTLLEATLRLHKARLGDDHLGTLWIMTNVATILDSLGRPEDALPLLEDALKRLKVKLGNEHPRTLVTMSRLASVLQSLGRSGEALPLCDETLRLRKARLGEDHTDTLGSMDSLARALTSLGRTAEALSMCEETQRRMNARLGADHILTLMVTGNLARYLFAEGRTAESLSLYEEVLRLQKAKLGEDHPSTLSIMNNLATALQSLGQDAEALPLFEEVLRLRNSTLGPENRDTLETMESLIVSYVKLQRRSDAEALILEVLPIRRKQLPPGSAELGTQLAYKGWQLLFIGRGQVAEPILRESLEIRENLAPNDWTTHNARSLLGEAMLLGHWNYAEAEPLLKAGFDGLVATVETIPHAGRFAPVEAAHRLVILYDAMNRPEEAAKYRVELEKWRALATPPAPQAPSENPVAAVAPEPQPEPVAGPMDP